MHCRIRNKIEGEKCIKINVMWTERIRLTCFNWEFWNRSSFYTSKNIPQYPLTRGLVRLHSWLHAVEKKFTARYTTKLTELSQLSCRTKGLTNQIFSEKLPKYGILCFQSVRNYVHHFYCCTAASHRGTFKHSLYNLPLICRTITIKHGYSTTTITVNKEPCHLRYDAA